MLSPRGMGAGLMCKKCIHAAVCAKRIATGGHVRKCEHYAAITSLEDLAFAICNSIANNDNDCVGCYDGSCPAADYCRYGHNGMVDFLRKVATNEQDHT